MPHNFFHLDPEQMGAAMADLDEDIAAERRLQRRLEQEQRLVADEFPTGLHGRLAIHPHIRLSGNQPNGSTFDPSVPNSPYFFGYLQAYGVHLSGLSEPLSLADQHEREIGHAGGRGAVARRRRGSGLGTLLEPDPWLPGRPARSPARSRTKLADSAL